MTALYDNITKQLNLLSSENKALQRQNNDLQTQNNVLHVQNNEIQESNIAIKDDNDKIGKRMDILEARLNATETNLDHFDRYLFQRETDWLLINERMLFLKRSMDDFDKLLLNTNRKLERLDGDFRHWIIRWTT